MKFNQITFEVVKRVARIGFGKYSDKPRPTLELETLEELDVVLEEIKKKQNDEIIGLVLFSHKSNVFLGGMNVKVIKDLETVQQGIDGAKDGQDICNKIEDLEIPTVACIDGVCIGGGTELASSCKIIAASDSPFTVIGVPEVELGLLPAFGGTYRMLKKISLPDALDLILTGRMISAKTAKKMGLVDQIYPVDRLVEMAVSDYIIERRPTENPKGMYGNDKQYDPADIISIFKNARIMVGKETGGHLEIPFRIIDHMQYSLGKPRSVHLQSEADLLGEIAISQEARNLQNIYWLYADSQNYTGPAGNKEKLTLKKGAIVGAGNVGSGAAWLMAMNNMAPVIKDLDASILESANKRIESGFANAVKRNKISEEKSRKKQESIKSQVDYKGFNSIDIVLESVTEEIGIKKDVLSGIEKEVSDDCLITSSTSSLSINELASVLSRPERFTGLHFFNPINRVLLVEIITHEKTAHEIVRALYEWVVRIKKVPVVVKDAPGFVVNRIRAAYINEGLYLLEEGVTVKELDAACLNFGMPAGPVGFLESMGRDECLNIINTLNKTAGSRFAPAPLLEKFETGAKISKILPAIKIKMSKNEIQNRVITPMINEAAYILEERVVETVQDIDLALVFGAGFPRFRGGLLKFADTFGLANVLRVLDQLSGEVDAGRFKASSIIKELAEKNGQFYGMAI